MSALLLEWGMGGFNLRRHAIGLIGFISSRLLLIHDLCSQKYVREFNLHMRWDASGKPVLDTLNTAGRFVVSKQFSNLCWPAKTLDEFDVFFHSDSIKHYV